MGQLLTQFLTQRNARTTLNATLLRQRVAMVLKTD